MNIRPADRLEESNEREANIGIYLLTRSTHQNRYSDISEMSNGENATYEKSLENRPPICEQLQSL